MMLHSQFSLNQLQKTFVFEDQLTSQSILVQYKIVPQLNYVNLKPFFDIHCPHSNNQIFIFDTIESKFINIEKLNPTNPTLLPLKYVQFGFIMIRYKSKFQDYKSSSFEESQSEQQSINNSKKDRSKQRTIGQVIQLVKKWRALHMQKDFRKKLNLQESAKVVGVSKKSLDDYYYQLRLGQQNNFDFESNLGQKIGVLRNYVKDYKPQKVMKNRNVKHPKKLKIIEQYGQAVDLQEQQEQSQKSIRQINQNSQSLSEIIPERSQVQSNFFNQDSGPLGRDMFQSFQNQYYQNFQFLLDEPSDPFMYQGSFKKKSISFESDDFQF